MFGIRITLFLAMFPTLLSACEFYPTGSQSESVLFHSPDSVCFSLVDGIQYDADKPESSYDFENHDSNESDYWSDWVLKSETNPLVTRALASNYLGIGIWVPHELENNLDYMDPEEWILSHGLQFSLGFGKKNSGEPRMRLDYRWHESFEGDLTMLIELPL